MSTHHPILVAGRTGQLARCLIDAAAQLEVPLLAVGRPDLDMEDAASIVRTVESAAPRAIINAAGYTLVDEAESNLQQRSQ